MAFDPIIDAAIRRVPDFPKPGILFYDITSILVAPPVFSRCLDGMAKIIAEYRVEALVAIESRGFIFAAPLARDVGLPLILARKKGKLPGRTLSKSYALEYGRAEIEMHAADLPAGKRVAIIDDLVATGGTIGAVAELLREGGALPVCSICAVGLPFLGYEKLLSPLPVRTLVDYQGE
jgi:adenine phosphoribosyltransferase